MPRKSKLEWRPVFLANAPVGRKSLFIWWSLRVALIPLIIIGVVVISYQHDLAVILMQFHRKDTFLWDVVWAGKSKNPCPYPDFASERCVYRHSHIAEWFLRSIFYIAFRDTSNWLANAGTWSATPAFGIALSASPLSRTNCFDWEDFQHSHLHASKCRDVASPLFWVFLVMSSNGWVLYGWSSRPVVKYQMSQNFRWGSTHIFPSMSWY